MPNCIKDKGYLMFLTNRAAVIVKAKKPFLDWINYTDGPKFTLETVNREGHVYLIPEHDTPKALEEILKELYEEIFVLELNSFCTDQGEWPKLNYKMFREWFDIEVHSMVFDPDEDEIEKEDF